MLCISPWTTRIQEYRGTVKVAVIDLIIESLDDRRPDRERIITRHLMTEPGATVLDNPSAVTVEIVNATPAQIAVIEADGRVALFDRKPVDVATPADISLLHSEMMKKCRFTEAEIKEAAPNKGESWGRVVENFRVWMVTP